MQNKNRIVVISDADRIFNNPSGDIVNRVYSRLDHTLRIIPKINKSLKENQNDVVVIGANFETRKRLQKANIPSKSLEDYVSMGLYDEVNEKAMKLIRNNKHLEVNPTFKKIFSYNGTSLWNLQELSIHDTTRKLLYNIEIAKNMIDIEKPDLIIVADDRSMFGRASIAVAKRRSIPTQIIKPMMLPSLKHHFRRYLKIHFVRFYENWKKFLTKKLTNMEEADFKPKKNMVIVFSDELRHAPQIIPWAREILKNSENEVLVIGENNNWRGTYIKESISYKTFEQYANKELDKKIAKKTKLLLKNWKIYKEGLKVKKLLNYNGISLFELLDDDLSYLFSNYFPQLVWYIEVVKHIISREKPNVAVVMCDLYWFDKTCALVSKLMKVPTLMVQHGVKTDSPIQGPTVVDKMAVFGESTKNVLINREVKPEKIVVTGRPQWDELVLANRFSRKKQICQYLGLDENKRIILFDSSGLADERENHKKLLYEVFNAMKKLPNIQFVNKLHPQEKIQFNKSIAEEVGIDNVVITKEINIFDILSVCDVFITEFSTAGIEAMIMNKPVITINLFHRRDPMPYAESGAAVGVYNSKDIVSAIKCVLEDSTTQRELEKNRKEFVYYHAYKTDGQASKRVADLIMQMIQESKERDNQRY